jgi:hypothetical protein
MTQETRRGKFFSNRVTRVAENSLVDDRNWQLNVNVFVPSQAIEQKANGFANSEERKMKLPCHGTSFLTNAPALFFSS